MVIALFSVLASFAIPSYQRMIQNTQIRTATDSILTGLQIARAEAVARNTKVQFDFRTGSAWTVCTTPAGNGSCPTTDDATTVQSRGASDGSSANVTINTNGNNGPYVFTSLGGLDPAGALTIDIDNTALSSGASRNLRVSVGAGGLARSCDPALDASGTDPRRC